MQISKNYLHGYHFDRKPSASATELDWLVNLPIGFLSSYEFANLHGLRSLWSFGHR